MNFTFHQLRIFLKVIEHQSVTKAAEELHLTQPGVSIQLKNFQSQFEIPLTQILSRRLIVTDFGHKIAESARLILEGADKIEEISMAFQGLLAGSLKVSIVSTGKYVMPFFLTGFLRQHPQVKLQMDVTNKAKVVQSVANNEVDFSLVSILPEELSTGSLSLMPNELYLVGNKDETFGEKKNPLSILEKLPLIFREQGSGTRLTMERFFSEHNLEVDTYLELTSNEAVKQAVIAGLGYSVLPLIGIREELMSGTLQIIPVRHFPIRSTWQLIWPEKKVKSPAAEKFLEYVETEKQRIISSRFNWYADFAAQHSSRFAASK
jgi:DNA-binding transcriptional LysR family regulator